MQRTGLTALPLQELGDTFRDPHTAYLDCLLDNRMVGFVPTMSFYVTARSRVPYGSSRSPEARSSWPRAAASLALVLALLFAAVGSQTFYPGSELWACEPRSA
jgi:hypothetical protein